MNEYIIEVRKERFFWVGWVKGYNNMDWSGPMFTRLTEHQASNAAIRWCKRHDKKLKRKRIKFTYIP